MTPPKRPSSTLHAQSPGRERPPRGDKFVGAQATYAPQPGSPPLPPRRGALRLARASHVGPRAVRGTARIFPLPEAAWLQDAPLLRLVSFPPRSGTKTGQSFQQPTRSSTRQGHVPRWSPPCQGGCTRLTTRPLAVTENFPSTPAREAGGTCPDPPHTRRRPQGTASPSPGPHVASARVGGGARRTAFPEFKIEPARAYAQWIVTTRLLYHVHDPAGRLSRMQRI